MSPNGDGLFLYYSNTFGLFVLFAYFVCLTYYIADSSARNASVTEVFPSLLAIEIAWL